MTIQGNFFEVLSQKPLYDLADFLSDCFQSTFIPSPDGGRPIAPPWVSYEVETIIYQIESLAQKHLKADSLVIDDLIFDKIEALKTIFGEPNLFFDNLMFFIYTTQVVLNESPDFEEVSLPNSLEMAQSIREVSILLNEQGFPSSDMQFSDDMAAAIGNILKEEGFSEPTKYFSFVPEGILQEGQEDTDIANKELGITSYLNYLDNTRL